MYFLFQTLKDKDFKKLNLEHNRIYKKLKKPRFSIEESFNNLTSKINKYSKQEINKLCLLFNKTEEMTNLMLTLTDVELNDKSQIISFKGLEFKICKYDEVYFLNNYTKIKNPNPNAETGIIPFKLWNAQIRLLNYLKEKRFLIIRKSRQIGYTTVIAGHCCWQMNFYSGRNFPGFSKNGDESKKFKEKVEINYKSIPNWLKTKAVEDNKHTLQLINQSTFVALTSSKEKGRGESGTLVIYDEAAFIEAIDTIWKASFPTISQSGGHVCVLSTVNGIGNWYFQTYSDAVEGKNDFFPLFIKWWEIPQRDNDWLEQYEKGDLSFVPEGMTFREFIQKIENFEIPNKWLKSQKRQLGDRGFRQEVLAEFLGSGDTVFEFEKISEIQKSVEEPSIQDLKVSEILHLTKLNYQNSPSKYSKEDLQELEDLQEAYEDNELLKVIKSLWIWETPKTSSNYCLVADVGTGRSEDFSAFVVLDIETNEQVVEYKDVIDPVWFTKIINLVAIYFNGAFVIVESNSIGLTVLSYLLDNENIKTFNNNVFFEQIKNGFRSYHRTEKNRDSDILTMKEALISGELKIKSERITNEILTFVWVKKGLSVKPQHSKGTHDDLLLALSMYSFFCRELKQLYYSASDGGMSTIDGSMIYYDEETGTYKLNQSDEDDIYSMLENPTNNEIFQGLDKDEEKFKRVMRTVNKVRKGDC